MHARNRTLRPYRLLLAAGLFAVTAAASGCGQASDEGDTSAGKQPDEGQVTATDDASLVDWRHDLDKAMTKARKTERVVAIDFYADWCVPCKQMDRTTFQNEQVVKRLKDFVPVKIDIEKQEDIAKRYNVQALPTTLIVDHTGEPVGRQMGYLDADTYLDVLNSAEAPGKSAAQTTSKAVRSSIGSP